ncbi:phage tail tape measure protein [Mannheimia haemolytica USDA-ARS-USMARC-185]|uniref:phage tail tape measure protein n=2 Tax=Mannheimia haemolytica TaxID=75985 RepID=UPI0002C4F265|nr:phage tail tape measure protein [Mannheimia haemolytica]AGI35720.1 phage tail tape measure protein [Mannheimia haemolytica USDA-ARS-USMARC-185]
MSGLGKLTVTLELENAKFSSAMTKSDYEAQKFARNFVLNMDQATAKAKQFAQRTTDYLNNIEQAAKNINTATKWEFRFNNFDRVKNIASTYSKIADSYTELGNKLRLVTENESQHARAMAAVYDISLKTAQSTEATSSVYQTFAQNAKQLGISQNDVAKLTETVAKSVAVSGASSATASNALVQFSQSLLMGKLKAQEFNSLMTQTPSVIQAIAKGLGVTTAELKAMVDNGEMSAEKMIEGLKKAESYVNGQYAKTTTTISGAMQNLSTAAEKWVGEMDSTVGVSQKAVAVLNALNANFDTVAKTVLVAGGAFALFKGYMNVRPFIESRAAIYENQKAIIAENQARQQAMAIRQQELVGLSQQTALKLEQTLQTYNQNKAELEAIAVKQQKITKEREEIAVAIQAAATRSERLALSAELQALDQKEITLGQQKIAVERQQIAAKQALKVAYAENAVAQSAMSAGMITATTTTRAMNGVLAAARAELNLLKAAALSNPLMTLAMVATTAGTALWGFFESQKAAREEALRYADSLDSVRVNIEKMTKAQTDAEMVKLSHSIKEQETALANLKQRQAELTREIEQGATVYEDAFAGTVRVTMSAEELAKKQEELTLVTADAEKAQKTLNSSLEAQEALKAHIPIANLREEFVKLYPHIDESQIKVDSLNLAIGNFTVKSPEMVIAANNIANALGGVAGEAMRAAILVANLSSMKLDANGAAIIDPKHLETIEQIERNNAIGSAKGKDKIALQVKDALIKSGMKEGDAGYERLKAAYEQQFTLQNAPKGGGKPKKTKAERSAESYQNQVAEMTNRLSGLKIDKEDLVKYGGISQYQEVRKLTEDIAINAEKYKGYGEQGVARLKELASQLDSAQQQVAISQFAYNGGEKLKAMEFELTLLGKTRQEQELMQYNHELDLEAARLKIGMTDENIAKLDQEIVKLKERRAEIQAQAEQARGSFKQGMLDGLNNIEADVSNVAANVANITQNTFDGMADSLTNFVMTGKADFRSFANSILSDLSKMIIKMMLFNAIKQGATMLFGYQGPTTTVNGNAVYGLGTWATGGYTGDGGKYTPAGIVHKGEYVITKEATSRLGVDYLNYLNYGTRRGFANGGGVAVPRVPKLNYGNNLTGATHNQVSITVNVESGSATNSEVSSTADEAKALGKLIESKVLEVIVKQKRNGNLLA